MYMYMYLPKLIVLGETRKSQVDRGTHLNSRQHLVDNLQSLILQLQVFFLNFHCTVFTYMYKYRYRYTYIYIHVLRDIHVI